MQWQISHDGKSQITFAASIEPGWHIYGMEEQAYGLNPTVFTFETVKGAQLIGDIFTNAPLITAYDKFFGMDTNCFKGSPFLYKN